MTDIDPIIPTAEVAPFSADRPNLRRDQVPEYLRRMHGIERTVSTLAKLAVTGLGPRFFKDGKWPLYPVEELDKWARARLGSLRTSTSDKPGED